ncbi:glycosyltransferase family 2 protein [Candidatus Saccharibacteria bacterium]|nr:glycosyltransferase family 2 protein [Candidatus Saccharibacteria bacterium]
MGNKSNATVGIFMPAYNHGAFVDGAIESLRQQTFQKFELHIVDDGSNDGLTPKKLCSIKYDKAKLFLNKDNRGVAYRAREHFNLFKTDYILVLCADDILAPDFLEKTVAFLEKNQRYGAVGTNVRFFVRNPKEYYYEQEYDSKKMILKYELARNQVLGSSLMRTKALKETDLSGGFVRYQDWDRWISMMEKGWKIGLVPEYLFYYRQLPSSLSHSASVEDELKIRDKLLKKHKVSYEKYYKDVILTMEQSFLEMKESKDWLDGEYHRLKKENAAMINKEKELEGKILCLNEELTSLKNSRIVKAWLKARKMVGLK